MSAQITLQHAPDPAVLEKREQLAAARNTIAEREAELAQLRAQLASFEGRYLREVGSLYAELDELHARIAEREAELYDSETARTRAEDARQRAQETRDAAFGDAADVEPFDPPPGLKTLFREVAKRIHPDFACDEAERTYFTLLMARANHAYSCGNTHTLERLLDDQREVRAAGLEEGSAAELFRMTRQIQHAVRDIAALEEQRRALLTSDIGQLHRDAETAAIEHRNLLAELAATLREQIATAERSFELISRQLSHER